MKNKGCYLSLFLSLIMTLFLSGCVKETPHYDAGRYTLFSVILDGQEIPAQQLYPNGAFLLLAKNGEGWLTLGEAESAVTWEQKETQFVLSVNTLKAQGEREENLLSLTVDELGITFVFSAGTPQEKTDDRLSDSGSQTVQQQHLNGVWHGRLWFEDTAGEWEDYRDRSMAVWCSIALDDNGEGELKLYQNFYSEDSPMAQISLSCSDESMQATSGHFMSYPVLAWGMRIELRPMYPSQMRNSIILHPDVYEYGHFYVSENEPEEETEVLSLSGRCQDTDGSFSYFIEMTRE